MTNFVRSIIITVTLGLIWHLLTLWFNVSSYILPSPLLVAQSLWHNFGLISQQAIPTIIEAVIGFICSLILGSAGALILSYYQPARAWFLPILLISQALPTFAIAPLLVIWFGYGMTAKIITTILMLFFPITSAFYDGLKQTPKSYLELAQVMQASKLRTLWLVQIPAALPALGHGLRTSATFAPMGAIIGEWVGASQGLGLLILNANARMQIDLMFAAILVLIVLALLFYFAVDRLIKLVIFWQ